MLRRTRLYALENRETCDASTMRCVIATLFVVFLMTGINLARFLLSEYYTLMRWMNGCSVSHYRVIGEIFLIRRYDGYQFSGLLRES